MSENKLQPVRGTKDLFGQEIIMFNHIIDIARKNADLYGFEELQLPIFEFSEIFERNLGEASDIVAKEVYKFLDRGDNYLTLRPEFTASVVRAFISNSELQQILPKKLFSFGPLFRYERPQKGRQRQFNQINFEILGEENYYADAELILLACRILKDLEILQATKLDINSLGCTKTKENYQLALQEYFLQYENELSFDSKNRLQKNPLRILDSKDQKDIELCFDAPQISNYYSKEAKDRFDNVLNLLEKFGVKYNLNQKLVRGLDYYTSTIFEFINNHQGAQNTVLAGGRYDDLIAKMGAKATPAIGYASGIERLMLLSNKEITTTRPITIAYIDENQKLKAFEIANKIRKQGLKCEFIFDANFKKQMKKANQNNSRYVIILGEEEIKNGEAIVKDFDNSKEYKIKQELLGAYLEGKINDN
jgi:histidyl-tRNA synthetase